MTIYLRLIWAPLLLLVLLCAIGYSRNELLCYGGGGEDGLRLMAERYVDADRPRSGLTSRPDDVKCQYTGRDVVSNMTVAEGHFYVYCSRKAGGGDIVFVLSRFFIAMDEVYMDI